MNPNGTPTATQGVRDDDWSNLLKLVGHQRCKQSFAELFKHFAPLIKGYCLSNAQFHLSAELADELVQEAMLKVWSKSPSYDPKKAAASTWIFTVMRNCRIDMLRKSQRHNIASDPIAVDDVWDETLDHQPVIRLEQSRDKDRINANIGSLPTEQQDALRQVYIHGKSHSEIAAETGLPLGTVKSRVRIGLQKLKVALGSR